MLQSGIPWLKLSAVSVDLEDWTVVSKLKWPNTDVTKQPEDNDNDNMSEVEKESCKVWEIEYKGLISGVAKGMECRCLLLMSVLPWCLLEGYGSIPTCIWTTSLPRDSADFIGSSTRI